jgi:hypothetical protein
MRTFEVVTRGSRTELITADDFQVTEGHLAFRYMDDSLRQPGSDACIRSMAMFYVFAPGTWKKVKLVK